MVSTERHRRIVTAVGEAGQLSVADLASMTGASEMTVRRDLEILSEQGLLERYRGGARSVMLRGEEPPFALRAAEGLAAKQRIAAEVAGLITDGETVLIDSGTTCLEVARALQQRRLTVMPLSLHALNALTGAPRLRLLVPGGEPRPGELALIGPLTEASLAAVRFDTAVLGCCGLTAADGLTAYDLAEAAIKRAAISSARRVIAVAEAGKLSRTALAFVAPAAALNTVVTEEGAPQDATEALAAAGVTVRTVRVTP
ncbi:transcriptional regulator, DeoR family [Streptomyces sp. DvalAA-14]|uniref:DeoR/GlpR family DNA-binding transcription regulator n=1 Tax=unclassified Streptomyces TaxID=2593676 RepID=UPI00081AF5F1|nr:MULTISPECIES: DeoR/GlpR family DNA-binding transcription regulator [unclassified Streptomyces]MYS23702.1 DeoR family transcriptional regulator [Streptomyces sp. SID4948]SCE37443.1 transcriptional regulator, DeoR family [Streptomyces sp. DvalAA-14]